MVFYFLLIRPQAKRQKEHKKMVEALTKGDEMVTVGGIAGRVMDMGDNSSWWRSPTASRSRSAAPPSRPCCPRAP